mgnify:FL=1
MNRSEPMNHDVTPSAIGILLQDAEIERLILRTAQTEQLMETAMEQRRWADARTYRRLCGVACAACADLLTRD